MVMMAASASQSIPETFAGADVFVTGGSGFMGKVLIEKLLRSCPEIGRVFVLLRPRKGKSPEERVTELVQVPLFDKLRAMRPEDFQKIVPISGDCSQLRVGMDEESLKRVEDVQFVFHAAASVRFDDPLEKAILLNTRGTREVIYWAKTLKRLRALVHVSTTYSNPEIFEVEERIYPAKMDWRKAIEMAEKLDGDVLQTMCHKLTSFAPNTYTFAKGLAEQICDEYHRELPIVVFRPSVVTNTEEEPIPGWIDNFNGPVGMLMGMGIGLLRTGHISLHNRINCIPADVSIKAIIIAAWKKANEVNGPDQRQLTIYNSAAEVHKTADYNFLVHKARHLYLQNPMSRVFWSPGGVQALGPRTYYALFFMLQLIPSVLVDFALKLRGTAPFMVRLQRKIFDAQLSLKYFTDNEWVFKTDNFRNLSSDLKECDKEIFDINYMVNGLEAYYHRCILGGRRYLMKESDDTIPAAKKKLQRLTLLNTLLKTLFYCLVFYALYRRYHASISEINHAFV